MPYCPKCGNKVEETMTFCPICGASLKMAPSAASPMPPPANRNEKQEKNEKHEKSGEYEKGEKGEKHEKGEFGFAGWIIGGVLIIILGFFGYVQATGLITGNMQGALVLLVIGIAVIIIAVWLSTARRRNPPPPT